jgi:transposase
LLLYPVLHADRAYDTEDIRRFADQRAAWTNIPSRRDCDSSVAFCRWVYRQRNLVERFFNKLKGYRGTTTRRSENTVIFLAAIKVVAVRLFLKSCEIHELGSKGFRRMVG